MTPSVPFHFTKIFYSFLSYNRPGVVGGVTCMEITLEVSNKWKIVLYNILILSSQTLSFFNLVFMMRNEI